VAGEEDEVEAVLNLIDAVLNGDSGHGRSLLQLSLNQGGFRTRGNILQYAAYLSPLARKRKSHMEPELLERQQLRSSPPPAAKPDAALWRAYDALLRNPTARFRIIISGTGQIALFSPRFNCKDRVLGALHGSHARLIDLTPPESSWRLIRFQHQKQSRAHHVGTN
jgi:hypothetical protein